MQTKVAYLCDGATREGRLDGYEIRNLDISKYEDRDPNIKFNLPKLTGSLIKVDSRLKDLVEIASYVYCGDRLSSRGRRDDIVYSKWSRSLKYIVQVRDEEFWSQPRVVSALRKALTFMTGDAAYEFTFQGGRIDQPSGLFDREEYSVQPSNQTKVILYSGGLDSLAGVIQTLEESDDTVCLVTHRSAPSSARTQNALKDELAERYPSRVRHYKYGCSLNKQSAVDETQRSRMFLYSALGFVVARAHGLRSLSVFENGVTAMNLGLRQDSMLARSSRTVHPQTVALLQGLYSLIADGRFDILTPFAFFTKSDVFQVLKKNQGADLIDSSVSCGRTRSLPSNSTHCGVCTQCIDRRLAAFASECDAMDQRGIYDKDFVYGSLEDRADKGVVIDYISAAVGYHVQGIDWFYADHLTELGDLVDYVGASGESEAVEIIYDLHKRHGQSVEIALQKIRNRIDTPFAAPSESALLEIIANRDYLSQPVHRLREAIESMISRTLPLAFKSGWPTHENILNDHLEAVLNLNRPTFEREYPTCMFAGSRVIPDHFTNGLVVEGKIVRRNTKSKVQDEIIADIAKYPARALKLFVVQDHTRAITDDDRFKQDFRQFSDCSILIVR